MSSTPPLPPDNPRSGKPLSATPGPSPGPSPSASRLERRGAVPLSVTRRRELQQRFERAWEAMRHASHCSAEAHALLVECVTEDPACALYVDALLLNLRKPDDNTKRFWLGRWTRQALVVGAALRGDWRHVLRAGPAVLADDPRHLPVLLALIDAHHACGHRESAWRYVEEGLRWDERQIEIRRRGALVRMSMGHFRAAVEDWRCVRQAVPNDHDAGRYLAVLPEVGAARPGPEEEASVSSLAQSATSPEILDELRKWSEKREWEVAERLWKRALAAHGTSLELKAFGDELMLGRHREQVEVARRLVALERLPVWMGLLEELEASQLRLEIEILAARCRIHPHAPNLHAELGELLARQQNWPEAARCWEVASNSPDPAAAARARLSLAECRQRLRQFPAALEAYRLCLDHRGGTDDERGVRRRALTQAARLAQALGKIVEVAAYQRELQTELPAHQPADAPPAVVGGQLEFPAGRAEGS